MFRWGNLKQCSFQDCSTLSWGTASQGKHHYWSKKSTVQNGIQKKQTKKKTRQMMLMVCILFSKRTQTILIVLKTYDLPPIIFFSLKEPKHMKCIILQPGLKEINTCCLLSANICVLKKTKWTLVCSTHTGTHSYWEDRYFSRCATLMTAPWWEGFSAVEHMTVKGSVLSVSRCDSGMPGLGIGSCWKWCRNLNRAPGEHCTVTSGALHMAPC